MIGDYKDMISAAEYIKLQDKCIAYIDAKIKLEQDYGVLLEKYNGVFSWVGSRYGLSESNEELVEAYEENFELINSTKVIQCMTQAQE